MSRMVLVASDTPPLGAGFFITFRVGFFGLEKWHEVGRTVGQLAGALDRFWLMESVAKAIDLCKALLIPA